MTFTAKLIRRGTCALAVATGAGGAAAQDPLTTHCDPHPLNPGKWLGALPTRNPSLET